MIRRPSLSGRVGLIIVVALLAAWLAFVAANSFVEGRGASARPPAPMRLAALTELIERTPKDRRDAVLAALRTPDFAVWITPDPVRPAPPPARDLLGEVRRRAYRDALAPRALSIVPQARFGPLGFKLVGALKALEFRIALTTGETLAVRTESPVLMAPIGLPVGLGGGLVGVVIALIALIGLHREFRPLSRLADALDRIDPADDDAALPPIRARTQELRSLVAAFERLQARLSTLIHARLALVGGLQHDVRTFATRLRLRVEGIADPQERARAAADIEDMITLLDDALVASRAGASELDRELLDIAAIVAGEVADRRGGGAEADAVFAETAADAVVLGDRLAARRIVANLVDNAVRYGGVAHLSLTTDARDAVLTVDDEGPGIPPDRRDLLLEPFTRADASRARRTGGAGLGLAVVRSLALAHGGSVAIGDAPSGGARVTVRLPLFAATTKRAARIGPPR